MSDLRSFVEAHGVELIVRRHFDYDPGLPVVKETAAGAYGSLSGAMIYARCLDPAKLGLSARGVVDAIEQGKALARMDIIPAAIICGIDQRNRDGARLTAAGIKEITGQDVSYYTSPAATYPHYSDPQQLAQAIEQFDEYMVHMYLAGDERVAGLWTEPADVFAGRIEAAVRANYSFGEPILFDLNFEQLTLLYYSWVKEVEPCDIPVQGGWCPTKGGGIIWGEGEAVGVFNPDLTLVETIQA